MLAAAGRPARPPISAGPYIVAGIGRAGAAAATALAARGEAVHVWDGLGRPHEREAAATLAAAGVQTSYGGDGLALLDAVPAPRALVKSPGLRPDVALLRAARQRGLDVLDEAELGWRLDARPLAAITGTNGKSTTTALVAAVLRAAGSDPICAGNTRFGAPMSEVPRLPGDVVVAELSSFQLEGCTALRPQAAVFTNLTADHLYRHGTVAAYADCKRRLFLRDGVPVAAAAIGVDQAEGRQLAADLRAAGGTVVTFGLHEQAERRVLGVSRTRDGAAVRLLGSEGIRTLQMRLEGVHNALNVAGAVALADALQLDPAGTAAAIAATDPLPGRFERVAGTGDTDVIVDFAHNPDGVARACEAGRALVAERPGARLHVILSTLSMVGFAQARAVGRAAAERADLLVLTTQRWTLDDPAGELTPGLLEGAREGAAGRTARGLREGGAARIAAGPREGGAGWIAVEPDRADAIARALAAADAGDVVLILDRGELAGTLYDGDDHGRPFDDRAEVRAQFAAAGR